jgi:hypothetical protein
MESDPVLRFTEKFYDMTREEQIELNFKRLARVYNVYRDKYFRDYQIEYYPWYVNMF